MAAQQPVARPGFGNIVAELLSPVWGIVRLLASNRIGLLGLIGVLFFVLLTFVGPYVIPLDTKVKVDQIYAPPSWAHPFGTDSQGKDIWTQIVHGGRELILVAVAAALLSTVIG
jgi:peptide/nickel transport system permease protein